MSVEALLDRLHQGSLHDPFLVLGRHRDDKGEVVRAFLPPARQAWLDELGEMRRVSEHGLFEYRLGPAEAARLPPHYRIAWTEHGDGRRHSVISPWSFAPQLGDGDLHLFGEGRHHHAYRFLGARCHRVDGIDGVLFAVWAPGARRVSVVGDFNAWHGLRHPMRLHGPGGVWELFVPGLRPGDAYKYEILGPAGQLVLKADPYARRTELRPETASRVPDDTPFAWSDHDWLNARERWDWQHQPLSIYELHLGSWRRRADGGFLNYREIAEHLVSYARDLGFTHVELMPVMEHPLDESWGYQVTGFYAPTARYGEPDDLRWLIDHCHRHGIGVILDWVPGHFPRDEFALARFLGEPLYEHPDPRRGEHRDWGTLIFDYGRNEVRNFLLANAVYWLEEFHADGLRVDAVASMLYLDYSREPGDWVPNIHGGRENLDAIAFLRETNEVLHGRFPGALSIAEESTAWPMVSRPTWMGGLGFSMKWNMGWMNDTLSYFREDPLHRKHHHGRLTFGQLYAYHENFVLPLSHDEVVHMKGSLLGKMPGDDWQQFANLRLLLCWQFTHPGKQLLFMGGEFAQRAEWSEARELDWHLLEHDAHRGTQALVRDLNRLHAQYPALHRHDFESEGFTWLDCEDANHSVLAFTREGDGQVLVCVLNFTPVLREGYRVPLPGPGQYHEIFNSDSAHYGGTNCGNGPVAAEPLPWRGQDWSAALTLPPLGMLILEPEP